MGVCAEITCWRWRGRKGLRAGFGGKGLDYWFLGHTEGFQKMRRPSKAEREGLSAADLAQP